jgi:MFS family permease
LLVAISLVLGLLALRHMRRSAAPLVKLDALKVKSFFVSSVTGGIISRATISATPFLLPLMFQLGFGLSATAAGGWLIAYMAANLGMKTMTNPIITRFGLRTVLVWSSVLAGVAIAACAFIDPRAAPLLTGAVLAVAGATRSMQLTSITMVNFADIAPPQRQPASVLSSLTQQIGMGAGVAVGALLLMLSQTGRGASVLGLIDFRVALVAAGLMSALAALSYLGLAREVGDEIAGRKTATG